MLSVSLIQKASPFQCWWGRKRPSERVSFATFDVGTGTRAPLKTDEGQEVVTVAPGGDELKRCIASKAKRCHLLPGIHHESAVVDASRHTPLEITGTVDHEYLLRGIFMSTWGFGPAVFRPLRTVFPGLGAGFLNLGEKTEGTAKKRGKNEQKWARNGLKRVGVSGNHYCAE